MKRVLLCVMMVGSVWIGLHAEEPYRRHELSVGYGYANMLAGTGGLTLASAAYERDLRSGMAWEAQYAFYPWDGAGFGAYYSGFTSSGSHPAGADHVYTHYFAPQLSFYVPAGKAIRFGLQAGMGYMAYRNDSEVYGKERRVTGGRLVGNLGLRGSYRFGPGWALTVGAQYLLSNLREAEVDYHGETTTVRYPLGDRLGMSRLQITAGLSFQF